MAILFLISSNFILLFFYCTLAQLGVDFISNGLGIHLRFIYVSRVILLVFWISYYEIPLILLAGCPTHLKKKLNVLEVSPLMNVFLQIFSWTIDSATSSPLKEVFHI